MAPSSGRPAALAYTLRKAGPRCENSGRVSCGRMIAHDGKDWWRISHHRNGEDTRTLLIPVCLLWQPILEHGPLYSERVGAERLLETMFRAARGALFAHSHITLQTALRLRERYWSRLSPIWINKWQRSSRHISSGASTLAQLVEEETASWFEWREASAEEFLLEFIVIRNRVSALIPALERALLSLLSARTIQPPDNVLR